MKRVKIDVQCQSPKGTLPAGTLLFSKFDYPCTLDLKLVENGANIDVYGGQALQGSLPVPDIARVRSIIFVLDQ